MIHKLVDSARAFRDILRAPAAFWLIVLAFAVDSMAYFGMLTLMAEYLHRDIGFSDALAGRWISIFTGLVTIFMIGVASLAEPMGPRRGILLALSLCLVGRIAYSAAAMGGAPAGALAAGAGLLIVALGEGILQPLAYAGVKRYTDPKNSAMGYALIYALMNLGIVLIGLISPAVRVPVDRAGEALAQGAPADGSWAHAAAGAGLSGIAAVNWVCVLIGGGLIVLYGALMTRRAERVDVRAAEPAAAKPASVTISPGGARVLNLAAVKRYFTDGPFTNARFIFFIFMLLPVRTLFAHQWLTMPAYVLRAYPQGVADRMEWIVNWINPGIIFVGVPIIAALTRRANVYTLMIIGSAVSALPTFLLCYGPNVWLLISYLVIFSIGEAIWSPRFLQYAAELAPEGRVAQYMGLANVPWIVAKMTTGFYSGVMLEMYCPLEGPQNTGQLWLIYALIATASPLGLLLARGWVMRGWHKS